jgi:hypothetical protein
MTNEEIERGLLFNSLANIGDYIKLKMYVNPGQLEKDLDQFKDNWCPYNVKKDTVNNRWGLPVTSHSGDVMDNYHLNSFGYMQRYHNLEMREENFREPTQVYRALPEISKVVDMFKPDIGRVHFLKIGAGGFFPPHIDHVGAAPEYIRLITVFGKCKPENFVQLLNGKPTYFDPGYFYFANFQREHSVFSFTDYVYSLILTVKLNQRTHDLILHNMMNI